jgi:tetratricopeptide (TPR) repeat protein
VNSRSARNGGRWRSIFFRASLTALSLTLFTASSAPQVFAKKQATTSDVGRDLGPTASALGLSPKLLTLINQGKWKEFQAALEASTKDSKGGTREQAWLAFTYMFRNQCEPLKALSEQTKGAESDNVNAIVIQSFELLCEKKPVDSEKTLQSIPASAMSDAFVNFAFAASAGKQGKAAAAVTYSERTTELAPDFAWAYRTTGFLQRNLLKDNAAAEKSYAKAFAIEPLLTEAGNVLIDLRLAHNDFDGAIDVAKEEIAAAPTQPENHDRLAQIYTKQWRLRDAKNELQDAIALAPDNPKYYRSKAAILRYQGNFADAIADQQKAASLSTSKVFDLLELSSMESMAGRENDAVDHLKQVLAAEPGNVPAAYQLEQLLIKSGRFDDLVTELKALIDKDKTNEMLRIRLGNALVASGKLDQAIDAYKEAANLNQSDPEPHRKIGAIKIMQKDFTSAAKEYTRALNINSNSVPDLVALGFCYGQTDDYLQAEAAFVTALALHQLTQPPESTVPPTRQDIMRALATLLFEEGRYADAASQFGTVCGMSKASDAQPLDQFMLAQATALRDRTSTSFKALADYFDKLTDQDKAQQQINLVDTFLHGDKVEEAVKYLSTLNPKVTADMLNKVDAQTAAPDKATKDAPSTSQPAGASDSKTDVTMNDARKLAESEKADREALLYICWSRVWRAKKDFDRAERAAKQAIAISGQDGMPLSDAYCELGEVSLAKGNVDDAAKNARSALQVNLKSFRAYDLLGRIAMKRGAYKEAIEQANKSLELNPYYTEGYLLLGDAQAASGDLKNACSNYQKAANLYPGLLQTHQSLLSVLKKLQMTEDAKREESTIAQLKSRQ